MTRDGKGVSGGVYKTHGRTLKNGYCRAYTENTSPNYTAGRRTAKKYGYFKVGM